MPVDRISVTPAEVSAGQCVVLPGVDEHDIDTTDVGWALCATVAGAPGWRVASLWAALVVTEQRHSKKAQTHDRRLIDHVMGTANAIRRLDRR